MDLINHLDAKDAERDLHYCPCCKDRFEADEMDLGRDWHHSDAMRARYGAACCNICTDDHLVTEDGVLVPSSACGPRGSCVKGSDGWYSSAAALADARFEAQCEDADHAMYRGWV